MAKREFDAAAAESMTSAEIGAYLTERERRFAQAFNECLRGTEAAIRAGYSAGAGNNSAAHRASVLLRDPRIQAYRLALIRESAEDMALSRDSLALRLVDVFNRCTEAVPVMAYDHDLKRQVPTGEYQFDSHGALRALDQLCKLYGYYAPVKLSNPEGGPVLVQLSTEAMANGE